MKNQFRVVGQVILISAAIMVTLMIKGGAMAAEEKVLVDVKDVTVEKVKDGVFRITAEGTVPTSGWVVNLQPLIYVKPPETWEIEAMGIKPAGIVPQVITPWKASIEMNLSKETRQISVKGKNQTLKKPVPH